jgi:uncharacterized RDD family membrane protein YckC
MTTVEPANPVMDRALRVNVVEITTPEGVPLRFQVARAGDRMGAFMIDFGIIIIALLALGLVSLLAFAGGSALPFAVLMLAMFFLRSFYFAWFEIRWQGQTPGKRKMRIRVIDRFGGPLRAEAVLARNFLREVELFMPLALLMSPEAHWPGAPGWAQLLATVWALALLCLPLLNKHRLRVGDLVGGTLVVDAPKAFLLADLSAVPQQDVNAPQATYAFTSQQLSVYGIYELQVLEDVLRRRRRRGSREAIQAVCEQIKSKIKWDPSRWDVEPLRFLQDFYAAQRSALEHQMLLGKRRERKRTTRSGRRRRQE